MVQVGTTSSGSLFQSNLSADGVLYADASGVINSTAVGTATHVLTSNGAGLAPTFQSVSASGAITTITGNSGGAESPSAGNFNIVGTGSITVAGSANTETVQLTGLTNHALQIGAGTATLTQLGAGTTGQILQTNTGADPTWSTATYPSTATGTGTILRANGTNWVATTATYPATTTSQQILYSTSNNVVGELTTANSKFPATNSSGTLAMRALSVNVQVFTSSGTYTPTSGMLYCIIECIGGGGAGGGAAITGATTVSVGAGGGGGEYAKGTFSAATIGASKGVTIGAAGTANSGAAGGNGGNTVVGATTISANGGTGGGIGATAAISNVTGGAGGTGGTGGDFRTPGQNGFYGVADNGAINVTAGTGGNTQYGSGGLPVITLSANQGGAGAGYGAGGAGSSNYVSQGAALSGGAGTAGIVIVTEYVIA